MLVATLALLPAPAQASEPQIVSAGTIGDLQTAASGCNGTSETATTITLTGAIDAAGETVTVGCHVVLDLAGYALSVRNVVINSGKALTINDTGGGALTADAVSTTYEAGIRNTGATLTINGGTVTATGGVYGAGIGGGFDGAGGTTLINGGTVNATGVAFIEDCFLDRCRTISGTGAGIGGGFDGVAGTTTITGGTVNASGGINAAGIGGGMYQSGGTTTISGGTVTATADASFQDCLDEDFCFTISGRGAGIGGGMYGTGGTTTISGGTVTAIGGDAAGIGGGMYGTGGTTAISGGTVTALGGNDAAGIGGGFDGAGGTTAISGGTVAATGGYYGAGIGGGMFEAGGATTISGGTVTAIGGSTGSAIGAGFSSSGFGSLAVTGGVLRLPSGSLQVPNSNGAGAEITVGADGVIDGSGGANPTYATVGGGGQIDNGGAIKLPAANIGVTVLDRHYQVAFDTQGGSTAPGAVKVFADTFTNGNRTFPEAPTKAVFVFTGWNTATDGTGDSVTSTSVLPGASTHGTPVAITAYAQWEAVVPTSVSGVSYLDRRAVVSWTAPDTGPAPTDYEVTVYDGDGKSAPENVTGLTTRAVGSDATSFTFDGLTNGNDYTFAVRVVVSEATGADSQVSEVVRVGVPTQVVAVAGNGAATVTWTAPGTSPTITDYEVAVYAANGTGPARGVTGATVRRVGNGTTTFLFDGLSNGKSYSFRVRAVVDGAVGDNSAAARVVSLRPPGRAGSQ